MRTYFLLAGCMVLGSSVAPAQDRVQTQKVGSDVFFGGTLDGQSVSGIAQQIGGTVYYNLAIDGKAYSWTQPVIGSAAGQLTSPRFSLSPTGVLYTTHRVEEVEYRFGSDGCADRTEATGGRAQTTGNCARTVASSDR